MGCAGLGESQARNGVGSVECLIWERDSEKPLPRGGGWGSGRAGEGPGVPLRACTRKGCMA